jgi:hypothetical protein
MLPRPSQRSSDHIGIDSHRSTVPFRLPIINVTPEPIRRKHRLRSGERVPELIRLGR